MPQTHLMVQTIIQQFDDLFKVLDTFDSENFYDYKNRVWKFYPHKGNVRIAAETWTQIADLWAAKSAELRAWTAAYFAENKQSVYDKFYMDAAWKLIKDNLNHYSRFQEADEDFLTNCPDLSQWRQAEELVRAARQRMDFSLCDDEEILHQHDGLPCNDGLVCLIHEEMEWEWSAKVEAELRQTDNIFLNVESRNAFTGRPVAHSAFAEFGPIATSWTGPAKPLIDWTPFESIDGKTPFQAMRAFIGHIWPIRNTFSKYHKTDYDRFIELWNKIDFIDEVITNCCHQIAKILVGCA